MSKVITITVDEQTAIKAVPLIESALLDSMDVGPIGWAMTVDGVEQGTGDTDGLNMTAEDLVLRKKATNYFDGTPRAAHIVQRCRLDEQGRRDTVAGYGAYDDEWRMVGFVSLDALERETKQPSVKPLLVLSYRQRLDRDNLERIRASMKPIKDNGWMCVVLDEMSRDGAQAFDVPLPTLDTLSTDSIIEMLDALRRGREGQGAIEGGSISRS